MWRAAMMLWGLSNIPDAPNEGIVLRWEAPAQCPAQTQVDERIAELLGPGSGNMGEHVSASARVEHERGASPIWQLELELVTRAGSRLRKIESDDCASLAEVTALVVALAVDPLAVAAATAAAAQPEPLPTLDTTPVLDPLPQPDPPPDLASLPELDLAPPLETLPTLDELSRPGPRMSGYVAPRFGFAYGALPRFGPAVSIALGLELPRLRLEAIGSFLPPQRSSQTIAEVEVGGTYLLGFGGVRACPTLRVPVERSVLSFPLCLGLSFGAMRGEAEGLRDPTHALAAWGAASLGPALSWQAGRRFALWLGVETHLTFVRPSFGASMLALPLHESGWISVLGQLGIEVRFE